MYMYIHYRHEHERVHELVHVTPLTPLIHEHLVHHHENRHGHKVVVIRTANHCRKYAKLREH
jgi:hypothetical protein